MEKPSPSGEKLCEVFDFFLSKSLEPMKPEALQQISNEFDQNKANRYSNIMIQTVSSNSAQEFQEIIEENHVFEKLAKLDELKQSDGLSVNMKSFSFTPAPPEEVASRVVYNAKLEYIQKLKTILSSMDEKIQELEPRAENAQKRVEQAYEKCQQAQEKIQQVLTSH